LTGQRINTFESKGYCYPFGAVREPENRTSDIPESLIQYIWHHRRYRERELRTTEGHLVTVEHAGIPNPDQGPDFSNGRVLIGDIAWFGDIEIHRVSDFWYRHGHHLDSRYNRVVLHVVLEPDLRTGQVRREDGTLIPEIVLYPILEQPLRETLWEFRRRGEPGFPCERIWPHIPETIIGPWLDRLGHLRLESKASAFLSRVMIDLDVEQMLYEESLRALGYSKNSEPMARLAAAVPLATLRHLDDPIDIEALLLGASGLLPFAHQLRGCDRRTCDYVDGLRYRFGRISAAVEVTQLNAEAWVFSRLRPRNFPTLRIAQAASWVSRNGWLRNDSISHLYDALSARDPVRALTVLLATKPGRFWTEHARLDRRLKYDQDPSLGRTRIVDILVNVTLPFLWAWAEQSERAHVQDAVLDVFARLPASSDSIESRFRASDGVRRNAVHAQGVHHLFREWCIKDGCARCAVGLHILKTRAIHPRPRTR
jgi:hypothetical protein